MRTRSLTHTHMHTRAHSETDSLRRQSLPIYRSISPGVAGDSCSATGHAEPAQRALSASSGPIDPSRLARAPTAELLLLRGPPPLRDGGSRSNERGARPASTPRGKLARVRHRLSTLSAASSVCAARVPCVRTHARRRAQQRMERRLTDGVVRGAARRGEVRTVAIVDCARRVALSSSSPAARLSSDAPIAASVAASSARAAVTAACIAGNASSCMSTAQFGCMSYELQGQCRVLSARSSTSADSGRTHRTRPPTPLLTRLPVARCAHDSLLSTPAYPRGTPRIHRHRRAAGTWQRAVRAGTCGRANACAAARPRSEVKRTGRSG